MSRKHITFVNFPLKKISLNTIDLGDKTFLLSYGHSPDLLTHSIQKVGILNPPLLRKKSNRTYQIICGYKRIRALRKLGGSSTPCTILPSTIGDRECLLLSLYDNASHRELNPIEKSLVLNKLHHYYSEDTIVREFLSLLKLPPHPTQLNAFKPLCRLTREIKEAILEGTISEYTATHLSQIDRAGRKALGKLLIALRLSVSKQAEIMEYVTEIALRDSLPIEKVISSSEMRSILENKQLNQPQRGDALRNHLRQKRYPLLTKREKKFAQTLKRLKLHPHLHLTPPPYFEGNSYQLRLHFNGVEGLEKRLQELTTLLHRHSLTAILEG